MLYVFSGYFNGGKHLPICFFLVNLSNLFVWYINCGFLFHPCSQEDANNVKTNEELSHLKVENDTITTSYQIEDREGCWLHEVGMIIPQLENDESFSKFKGDMTNVEASFATIVEDTIKKTAKLF